MRKGGGRAEDGGRTEEKIFPHHRIPPKLNIGGRAEVAIKWARITPLKGVCGSLGALPPPPPPTSYIESGRRRRKA
jgi:hypothetical protein